MYSMQALFPFNLPRFWIRERWNEISVVHNRICKQRNIINFAAASRNEEQIKVESISLT